MSMQTKSSSDTEISLKGGMYTLTTIRLFNYHLEELSYQLDEKIKQAPNFFQYAPIILDLQYLRQQTEVIDFHLLIQTLKSKKLIPVGIRGASKSLKETAIQAGFAIFPDEKVSTTKKRNGDDLMVTETATPAHPYGEGGHTRVVTQPVRSGQQIYVAGGDLIVMAPVSHGAELLADGHIHVYGTLRGRAIAGVTGYQEAMIFCRSLEAELVSIAGRYRMSEDLKDVCWGESVCIQLQKDRLNIHSV